MSPSPSSITTQSGIVELEALSADAIDGIDAAVIGLDAAGTIRAYNEVASTLTGMSAEAVIGRNYFREIAPSTNVPGFYGRFLAGIRRGSLDERFEFVFGRMPHQPLRARIHMAQGRAGYWLVIVPLGVLAQGQSREAVVAAIGRRAGGARRPHDLRARADPHSGLDPAERRDGGRRSPKPRDPGPQRQRLRRVGR
jgi:photoactive yellow protein